MRLAGREPFWAGVMGLHRDRWPGRNASRQRRTGSLTDRGALNWCTFDSCRAPSRPWEGGAGSRSMARGPDDRPSGPVAASSAVPNSPADSSEPLAEALEALTVLHLHHPHRRTDASTGSLGRSAGSRLEKPRLMTMASLSHPSGPLTRFGLWLAEAINHAFGNPREEGAHLPPLVGVQPYRDRPRRRSR